MAENFTFVGRTEASRPGVLSLRDLVIAVLCTISCYCLYCYAMKMNEDLYVTEDTDLRTNPELELS